MERCAQYSLTDKGLIDRKDVTKVFDEYSLFENHITMEKLTQRNFKANIIPGSKESTGRAFFNEPVFFIVM